MQMQLGCKNVAIQRTRTTADSIVRKSIPTRAIVMFFVAAFVVVVFVVAFVVCCRRRCGGGCCCCSITCTCRTKC